MAVLKTFEESRPPRKGEHLILAEHMLAQGEDAVPLLIELLEAPKLRTRILAARKLRDVGDGRAIEPLCRAMETNTRRLPIWLARVIQVLSFAGLGVLISVVLVSLALFVSWLAKVDQGAWLGFSLVLLLVAPLAWTVNNGVGDRLRALWLNLMMGIGGQDDLVGTAVDALAAIAERSQGATIRKSLPLLRRVYADRFIHSRRTREAAARASAGIQMTTAALRRLPIACMERQISTSELPIAVGKVEPSRGR